MTIFKLSIAACAALVVGAWAEGAKARGDGPFATENAAVVISSKAARATGTAHPL
jgi:hypothetical protein